MSFSPRFSNLVTMFQDSIRTYGSRPLFGIHRDGTWQWMTYKEFGQRVDAFRSALTSLGVGRGDRVAIISNNRIEWPTVVYASHTLSATYVAMYESQLPKDWLYILKDSGAKVCFVANETIMKAVLELQKDLPELVHVVNFEGRTRDERSFSYLLEQGEKSTTEIDLPKDDDIATLIYTSGTTGKPKGTKLTHFNLASNTCGVQEVIPFGGEDRSLAFLPWAHVFGGSVEINNLISLGASLAICENTDRLIEFLPQVKPTVLLAVPRIWNKIYDGVHKQMALKPKPIKWIFQTGMDAQSKVKLGKPLSGMEQIALPLAKKLVFTKIVNKFGGRLKYAVSGAAALSKEVAEFIDNLGITVFEGYGMTEVSGVTTCNRPGEIKLGSVGKVIPGVTIKIDKQTEGADPREGEIVIYGSSVTPGYHNLPEETAQTIGKDGGLRSGDLGYLDEDGYLFITGRIKEIYKMANGKYVAPAPLEEKLTLSPFIAQAMIFGDNQPCNVALLIADKKALDDWAKGAGLDLPIGELLLHERTRLLFQQELEEYSSSFKNFEKISDFLLDTEEWTTQNDLLTPTLKVKRRNVIKRYQDKLDTLFKRQ